MAGRGKTYLYAHFSLRLAGCFRRLPHGQGIENVKGGTLIQSQSQLLPGDIILFGGSINNYVHVGIYAGNGYMWDANTAITPYPDGVQERTVRWETAALKFDGAVRF